MRFGYTEEQEALRKEVQDFIAENLTAEIKEEVANAEEGRRGPKAKELYQKIRDRGWVAVSWPKEWGGQGGNRLDQYIIEEEFARVGIQAGSGGGSGAPAIIAAGTQEQKEMYVRQTINGDVSFAQGFTEPQGGADLAGLQCRAVRDGDEWVINGQKIYTSSAHNSTHIYLMARTDPDAERHAGISIFLFPMDTPGITVRPLWTVQNDPKAPEGTTYGTQRTNETFFEDVRVPASAMLGEPNQGWFIGQRGLNLDRVGAGRYLMSVRRDEDMVVLAKETRINGQDLSRDDVVRDKTADMWIDGQVCRLMTMRSMSIEEHGGHFTYEGSAEKVWAPEHGVKTTETIAQILCPWAQLLNGSIDNIESGLYAHNVLGAYQSGINHGSVQIMRDQVARRGLNLPRGR
jgi:alkylation response protein AidB-like acyl-CoA dehydrogenase